MFSLNEKVKKIFGIGSSKKVTEAEQLRKIAKSIMQFWYVSEIFSQNDYYADAKKDKDNFEKLCKDIKAGSKKKKPKVVKNFLVLNLPAVTTSEASANENINEQIRDELIKKASVLGYEAWGDLTFYVGKISREDCITRFGEIISKADPKIKEILDARVEKNETKLAWFTFQLDQHGSYKKDTFSLSPNLWLLAHAHELDSTKLNKEAYNEDNRRLEEILTNENLLENANLESAETQSESKAYPEFAADAIDEERIAKVCRIVYKEFVKPTLGDKYQKEIKKYADDNKTYNVYCGVSYKLYADKEKIEEENDYMALFNSFFDEDLESVIEKLDDKSVNTDDLVEYITSAYSEMVNTPPNGKRADVQRMDIVNADKKTLLSYLQDILEVDKAPLGKWPSKYSPALTQQIAINNMVSIIEGKDNFVDKNVFSVNGPPGTGKTTLLKEIIVHCIVEKANVLCKFKDNPSAAFKNHKLTGQYEQYVAKTCHSFSDAADKLNDYSIVVTSCNNTAVENISKELPQQSKLLGDIGDEAIKKLFTVSAVEEAQEAADAQSTAVDMKKDKSIEPQYSDVYFTNEAINLFDLKDESGKPDIWGLIAAPLGKKKNINAFIKKALAKLLDQYKSDKAHKDEAERKAKENYAQAVDSYTEQRAKVLAMREELLECCRQAEICSSEAGESAKEEAKNYLASFKEKHDKVIFADENFVERVVEPFVAEGEQAYTGAQAEDPWFTAEYDREREKLLYYALQVIEGFVLASTECKTNLKFFEALWTGKFGSTPVQFTDDDRSRVAEAAYQTLFLVVPVISSTFASIQRFFKDVKVRKLFGLLVVDESGQAQPQMAVGSLYRARKAIIVGDPKQVEPVVTDELDILRRLFYDDKYAPYKDKTISVQKCADLMNEVGTYMYDAENESYEWLGCPLLVHRRCLSPMFDIANEISYAGIMKKGTFAKNKPTIFDKSYWIEAEGKEIGNKNHFVAEHGPIVCQLLDAAFENSRKDEDVSKHNNPSIYIISPFTSVVAGIKRYLENKGYHMEGKIGTVHTFQGKEAAEVIFLLGCDSEKSSEGAIKWVNNNIVNVAATRAKNCFYVVAQFKDAWEKQGENGPVYKMHKILEQRDCVLSWEEAAKKLAAKCPICGETLQRCETKSKGRYYWKCEGYHYYEDYEGKPVLEKCHVCPKGYILRKNTNYYICSGHGCDAKYVFDEKTGKFYPKQSSRKK